MMPLLSLTACLVAYCSIEALRKETRYEKR